MMKIIALFCHCERPQGAKQSKFWDCFVRAFAVLAMTIGLTASAEAAQKIKIAATTRTFASIAESVAGDAAEVYAIAPAGRNIHFVGPSPKDVLKTRKADVFIHGGLDLEVWRAPLLDTSGRADFLSGKKAIDVSEGIALLEIPQTISRSEGDIHLYGNPHYWLDPENAKIIAGNIARGLTRMFPESGPIFERNAGAFNADLETRLQDWRKRMEPYRGTAAVTYHGSWPYFAHRFGLEITDRLEPKPGIPPTAKHLAALIRTMKEKNVRWILKETFFENKTPRKVSEATGAVVLNLAQSPGEIKEAQDYLSMMEVNIRRFEEGAGA
jgi:ABC-type Zn uptake system ZnuABC Zn-binding protein ZnuA